MSFTFKLILALETCNIKGNYGCLKDNTYNISSKQGKPKPKIEEKS